MGIWSAIKKSVNSDLTKPLNTLINNLQSKADAINTTVNTINTTSARGVVKSVQSGTYVGKGTINIYAVNVSKSFFLLNGAAGNITNNIYGFEVAPYATLTSTTLNIANESYNTKAPFSWQVVEFY